jgi:bifunctional UDP-N-acetylglucosamine pyrophosphorylase/glucosamine-1-phosphate N-acetyltransferase
MKASLKALILAAGKGTRMKSRKAKVLHKAGGRTLVEHAVRAARGVSSDAYIVVGYQTEKVREVLPNAKFIEQKKQLGTGHAVMAARKSFAHYRGHVLILPGDVTLIRPSTLEAFVKFHRQGGYRASVLTADVPDPTNYGRIVRRGENAIERIVEHRDASPEILEIKEINSGIYLFSAPVLFAALTRIRNSNAQREYYLTDVVEILVSQGLQVAAWKAPEAAEILGINTRQELAAVDRIMRRRKCESLMSDGVTIIDPGSTFIDEDVRIGTDSVIYPFVQIYGGSVIGDDVTIHSYSRISNSKIGARATLLEGCVIADSAVGEDGFVGPFAHLRPGTALADKVKVGNFVEIKKSSLGEGTKAPHLAYVGDATVGKNVNIGAGVITCNYDGFSKHATVIEDDAFIGTDSQLIAPVRIGKRAYVAAGSSITDDVPPDALAIARGRQTIKEGWAKGRRRNKYAD